MKKLLVVLMAAIMVLSMAAVSMAAATVEGDFRWEWTKDDSLEEDGLAYTKSDLRLNFKGKVSDTVDAYLQYEFAKPEVKEYFVTMKQSWGKVQAGRWDHKLIPSRVLMKPHGFNCVNAKDSSKDMQWLFDVAVGDAMTVGLWLIPDLSEDEMDYDLKFGYKADSFGAEVHYGVDNDPVLADADLDANYTAFDFYYNVAEDIKVFAYAIDASDEYLAWKVANNKKALLWNDNLAPVIGVTFSNIAGSKLTASLEYGLEDAYCVVNDKDYAPIAVQLKYAFNNKVNLEVEYTNYTSVKDGGVDFNVNENKIVIRPRVKF